METINKDMIAPCGMDCAVCRGHLRDKKPCAGCNHPDENMPGYCISCKMRNCKERKGKYCFDCKDFPCDRLKRLDERYRAKYGMSEIENLEFIRDKGVDKFLEFERKRWEKDGGIFCVHDKKIYKEKNERN